MNDFKLPLWDADLELYTPNFSRNFDLLPQSIIDYFSKEEPQPNALDLALDKRSDKLVCLFLDGLAFDLFQELAKEFSWVKAGKLRPISCSYPTTTSVHVPLLFTGSKVVDSGVFEWYYYEPLAKTLFSPLPFRRKDEKPHEATLLPSALFLAPSLPSRLPHVNSHVWQESGYSHSIMTRHLADGAELHGYEAPGKILDEITTYLKLPGAQWHLVYLPQGDSMSHRSGLNHARTRDSWTELMSWIETFLNRIEGAQVWLFSDHGQSSVDKSRTLFLNEMMPQLKELIRRDELAQPLAPAGSCRNFPLYIEPDCAQDVQSELSEKLAMIARVATPQQLVEAGCFSGQPTDRFWQRMPSLMVLPRYGHSIWWSGCGPLTVQAQHGGLSSQELTIPLWNLSL